MKPLPSYARKVEYIESTGTQWIDTGIVPTDQTGFYVSAFTTPTGMPNNRLIGCYDGTTRFLFACSPRTSTNTFFGWNEAFGPYGNLVDVAVSASLNFLNDRKAVLNAETKVSDLGTLGTLTSTIFIFGHCGNGSAFTSQLFNGRLYSAKISVGSILVRDFIPCRINGIGYLWDEVEGRFYENKGTGNFVLGKDVREGVIPTRLNPMGVARRLDPVPFDAEVEYLESTGTQWISTPVKISSFGRLEVDASFTTWAGAVDTLWCARKIISSSNIQNSFALFKLANGTLGWDVRPTGSTGRITVNFAGDTNKHNYRQAGNALYIDGTQVATTTATISESGGPLYLFVSNFVNDEMTNPASGRLYKAEYFDENSNLVMQLVPVRKGGVGYLFDRVSGQLFGNAGSGAFVYGGDK